MHRKNVTLDLITAAAAVVFGVRLPVLMERPAGRTERVARARRVAQVAALQAGYTPSQVGEAWGLDRTTIIGRPGRVAMVATLHADEIATILDRAGEFAAMPPGRVARILDGVGKVALPPSLEGLRYPGTPVRVSAARGGSVLRVVS